MKDRQDVLFKGEERIFQDMSLEEQEDFWKDYDAKINLDDLTGAEIRLMMITRYWHSEDSYSTFGWSTWGYNIWFKRFNWHGTGAEVTFHSHTDKPEQIERCIRTAAKRALDAWDKFTDSVPCQLADGSVVEDKVATESFRFFRGDKK